MAARKRRDRSNIPSPTGMARNANPRNSSGRGGRSRTNPTSQSGMDMRSSPNRPAPEKRPNATITPTAQNRTGKARGKRIAETWNPSYARSREAMDPMQEFTYNKNIRGAAPLLGPNDIVALHARARGDANVLGSEASRLADARRRGAQDNARERDNRRMEGEARSAALRNRGKTDRSAAARRGWETRRRGKSVKKD